MREKIGVKFRRTHQMLLDRESTLLSELQQLEALCKGEGVTEGIQKLTASKRELPEQMEEDDNPLMLPILEEIYDLAIEELETVQEGRDYTGTNTEIESDHTSHILSTHYILSTADSRRLLGAILFIA